MECKKCEIDVPSQFEFILAQNTCPKCGNKLMNDGAMKIYLDLKKRLNEVEFVMDKAVVCERVAMFVINNYEVLPLNTTDEQPRKLSASGEKIVANEDAVSSFRAKLAAIDASESDDMTSDEIRAEEAARAEDIATAREMGMDVDEEMVSGAVDEKKVQRLKKLARTGQVGMIKRDTP
jgi:hypothetical protein